MTTLHTDDSGAPPADAYDCAQFSERAIERFPSLKSDLEYDANLLHCQMGTLAAAVRKAIAEGNNEVPLAICVFLDEVLKNPRAISEIENAVAISFVEPSELRASRLGLELLAQMPAVVREVLLAQEARYEAQRKLSSNTSLERTRER